jgi:hypothetical protein
MQRDGIRIVQFKLLVNKRGQLFGVLCDRTPQLVIAQLFATHTSFPDNAACSSARELSERSGRFIGCKIENELDHCLAASKTF